MLYLINCEVIEKYYKGQTYRTEMNHIVEGHFEEEVKFKLERYYDNKDVENFVTYNIKVNYINEVIK
jgi:hypothetical protein